jgi:hypothetical protein
MVPSGNGDSILATPMDMFASNPLLTLMAIQHTSFSSF